MVLFSGFSITFVERRCKVILQKPENVGMRKNGNNFLCSSRLKSYDKTRNPTIMSRNKAIWIAKLLFRRGQLSREEILAAWAAWFILGVRIILLKR